MERWYSSDNPQLWRELLSSSTAVEAFEMARMMNCPVTPTIGATGNDTLVMLSMKQSETIGFNRCLEVLLSLVQAPEPPPPVKKPFEHLQQKQLAEIQALYPDLTDEERKTILAQTT